MSIALEEQLRIPLEGDVVSHQLVQLLGQYENRLFAFLIVLLRDEDLARDCTQETFVRAYQNLRKGKHVTVQWLYRVGRNLAIDETRRQRRQQAIAEASPGPPEVDVAPSQATLAVRAALMQLSPEDREVLYLAEVDGFTSMQIGEMLRVRPGTIRMRLTRAHLRFRAAYGSAQ